MKKITYGARTNRLVLLAALALAMSACGGGGGGSSSGNSDTTSPTVAAITPESDAMGVAIDSAVSATFSEAMACTTVTAESFTLTDATGAAVNGSVSCSDSSATFTPTASLGSSIRYTATITTGAKDAAGNALAAVYSWSFTTADVVAPTVVQVTPAKGATGVLIDDPVTVTFSEPIDCATVHPGSFVLKDQGNTVVTAGLVCEGSVATLKPVKPLPHDAQFSVTVTTAVKDPAGNALAADYTWGFTRAAQRWGTPLSLGTTGDASAQRIAFNSKGEGFAVWVEADNAHPSVWASHYIPAQGWGAPELLEIDTADVFAPRIAINDNGDAFAIWQYFNGLHHVIAFNRFSGGAWGGMHNVSAATTDSLEAEVAMDADGGAMVAWKQIDAGTPHIRVGYFLAAGGGSTWAGIDGNTVATRLPQLAMNASGKALIAWLQLEGSYDAVFAATYSPAGGWSAPRHVSQSPEGPSSKPHVAINANGDAIVAWPQANVAQANQSLGIDTYTNGTWGGRYGASSGNTTVADVHTAIDGSGKGMFAYVSDNFIMGLTSSTVGASGGNINSAGATAPALPQCGWGSVGTGMAVWQQSDGTSENIWFSRYKGAGAWSLPVLLDPAGVGAAAAPQLAVLPDGTAIAVWSRAEGAVKKLWTSRFE